MKDQETVRGGGHSRAVSVCQGGAYLGCVPFTLMDCHCVCVCVRVSVCVCVCTCVCVFRHTVESLCSLDLEVIQSLVCVLYLV